MDGFELLTTLGALPAGTAAAAAIMRHAARHPIADPSQPAVAEITEEGAKAAETFGAGISGFDAVRLFHSPVTRCRQTTECIARGAVRAGLKVEVAGPRDELGIDYIVDLVEAGRLSQLHGHDFVRLWFQGQVPPAVIRPVRQVAAPMLELISGRLREPAKRGRRLDLHVSHDWSIIILRELLLGLRHEDTGWLTFLDGVAFVDEATKLQAIYRDRKCVAAK